MASDTEYVLMTRDVQQRILDKLDELARNCELHLGASQNADREMKKLRDFLRALVEDRWSGCFDYDSQRMYCTYCQGEMADDPVRVEHKPDCAIRKARELLGIPAEGLVIEHA